MRIAVLAHGRQPVAPPFRGGMEAHAFHLVEGLMARGHDVTLFASGDSDPRFAIDPVFPVHCEAAFPGREHRGDPDLVAHVDAGYAAALDRIAAGGFDVLHNNSLSRLPLEPRRLARVATVTSLHTPPYDALAGFVRASLGSASLGPEGAASGHRVTATSRAHAAAWWPEGAPEGVRVLHNGVDPALWPFRDRGDGSAAWCGRIAAVKGPHLAVEAARRAGVPLTLYGPIEEADCWRDAVAPALGGAVRYGGHLPGAALAEALGRASVFLFTPCWDEPFGLVAIEAMACGLPVAAFDRGAAREVLGEAGAFAPGGDAAGLAAAIGAALQVPRAVPRARVLARFTRDRWLDGCERLYAEARAARA